MPILLEDLVKDQHEKANTLLEHVWETFLLASELEPPTVIFFFVEIEWRVKDLLDGMRTKFPNLTSTVDLARMLLATTRRSD